MNKKLILTLFTASICLASTATLQQNLNLVQAMDCPELLTPEDSQSNQKNINQELKNNVIELCEKVVNQHLNNANFRNELNKRLKLIGNIMNEVKDATKKMETTELKKINDCIASVDKVVTKFLGDETFGQSEEIVTLAKNIIEKNINEITKIISLI